MICPFLAAGQPPVAVTAPAPGRECFGARCALWEPKTETCAFATAAHLAADKAVVLSDADVDRLVDEGLVRLGLSPITPSPGADKGKKEGAK